MDEEPTFQKELEALINKHGLERPSNTPDYILASFMAGCLSLFNKTVQERQGWYNSGETLPELSGHIVYKLK